MHFLLRVTRNYKYEKAIDIFYVIWRWIIILKERLTYFISSDGEALFVRIARNYKFEGEEAIDLFYLIWRWSTFCACRVKL